MKRGQHLHRVVFGGICGVLSRGGSRPSVQGWLLMRDWWQPLQELVGDRSQ